MLMPQASFFDADKAARQLTDNDSAVQDEIRQAFGSDVFTSTGDLNRGRIRVIILESAAKSPLQSAPVNGAEVVGDAVFEAMACDGGEKPDRRTM